VGKFAKAVAGVLVLAAGAYGSYRAGSVPALHLPGAALNWRLLFHVERAAAVLAIVGTVWLVIWRGLHGEFPIKFGNLEYAQKTAGASAEATASQERRLRKLEILNGIRDPADV
jgi:hypothetical protein